MDNRPLVQDSEIVAVESSTGTTLVRIILDRVCVSVRRVHNVACALEYALYRMVIVPLVAFLPAPIAYGVACLWGDWRYRIDACTRETIMRNLEDVFGERLRTRERARVARDLFRRRACEAVDVTRLAGKGHALRRLVQIRGLEHLEGALAAGKGVILCTGHFGQFAGAYSLLGAEGFPVTAVGNWPETDDPTMSRLARILMRIFYTWPFEHHRRPNIQPTKAGASTAIQMAEVLRANEVIAIPIDAPIMDPNDLARTVQVNFLGRYARLLPGSALIAKRTGAPLLTASIRRSSDWRHQILEISPAVLQDQDAVLNFKRCIARVEVQIHSNLAHWDFWESRHVLVNLGLVPGEAIKSPVYWDLHPSRCPATSHRH